MSDFPKATENTTKKRYSENSLQPFITFQSCKMENHSMDKSEWLRSFIHLFSPNTPAFSICQWTETNQCLWWWWGNFCLTFFFRLPPVWPCWPVREALALKVLTELLSNKWVTQCRADPRRRLCEILPAAERGCLSGRTTLCQWQEMEVGWRCVTVWQQQRRVEGESRRLSSFAFLSQMWHQRLFCIQLVWRGIHIHECPRGKMTNSYKESFFC